MHVSAPLTIVMSQRCGCCKLVRPSGAFSPSQRGKSGQTCRECNQARRRGEDPWRPYVERVCKECGERFVPTIMRHVFCSDRCKRVARTRVETNARREARLARAARLCAECSENITLSSRADARFCSSACRTTWHLRERQPARSRRRQEARQEARSGRCCLWCPGIIPSTKWATAKYCSPRCGVAANNALRVWRSAGLLGRPPTLADIMARDGWQCGICRESIDPLIRTPDSRACNIDHKVPVSKGGSLDLDNLQLSHAGCNRAKWADLDTLLVGGAVLNNPIQTVQASNPRQIALHY